MPRSVRPRPRLHGLAVLVGLVALTYLEATPVPPPEAPRIALSLDRNWLHSVGLTRFTYERMIRVAGGRPVRLLRPEEGAVVPTLAGADALLLSGGGDVDPRLYGASPEVGLAVDVERDRFELGLLEEAKARGIPVLGICRGMQLLNVVEGGTLRTIRLDPVLRRRHARYRSHRVRLDPDSRLAATLRADRLGSVTSFHGQSVGRPGEDVRVVAWSEDGIVEAIEVDVDGAWVVGVQWHPELFRGGSDGRRLFRAFVQAAVRARAGAAGSW